MRRLLHGLARGWPLLLAVSVAVPLRPAAAQQPRPAAADHPPLAPGRDASVLYRVTPAEGPPDEVRVTTQAGGSPMRIDMADKSFMLVDQRARRTSLVVMAEQAVMELPFQGAPPQFALNDRMRFARRGADTVAGMRCTIWDVTLDRQRAAMCITEDGIVLRTQSQDERGRRTLIEASSVSLAPATEQEFTPPPDYEYLPASPPGAPQ